MTYQKEVYKELSASATNVDTSEVSLASYTATHGDGYYKVRAIFTWDNSRNINATSDLENRLYKNSTLIHNVTCNLHHALIGVTDKISMYLPTIIALTTNDVLYFKALSSQRNANKCDAKITIEKVMDYINDL